MHIILIGANGYIGSEFKKYLMFTRTGHYVIQHGDVDNEELLCDLFRVYRNKVVIINCAGYTGKPNVDACEVNKEQTILGNVVFTQKLVNVCNQFKWTLAHVSSGCIYQGCKFDGSGFSETDSPNFTFLQNNCSFYSGTKAIAEKIVQEVQSHYIWRLRIPFDNQPNDRNYLVKLMKYDKLLNAENSLSNRKMFAGECIKSLKRNDPFGIYNVVNTGHIKTDVITSLLRKYITKEKTFAFFDSEEDFYKIAKTPRSNCILDNSKALSAGFELPNVIESIEEELTNWNK